MENVRCKIHPFCLLWTEDEVEPGLDDPNESYQNIPVLTFPVPVSILHVNRLSSDSSISSGTSRKYTAEIQVAPWLMLLKKDSNKTSALNGCSDDIMSSI